MSNYQSGFTGAQIDAAVGGAVRFDVEQSKTEAQKSQAQTNLGMGNVIADVSDLKDSFDYETHESQNLFDPDEIETGCYYWTNGKNVNASYNSTGLIPVEVGKTYYFTRGNLTVQAGRAFFASRFLIGYGEDGTTVVDNKTYVDGEVGYTVPNGVSYIRLSNDGYIVNDGTSYTMVQTSASLIDFTPYFDPYSTKTLKAECNNDPHISNVIKIEERKRAIFENYAASLAANANLVCCDACDNKKNEYIELNADFSTFSKLTIAHGKGSYGGSYIEITATKIQVYSYSGTLIEEYTHGLTLSDFINVVIYTKNDSTCRSKITIMSAGGDYSADTTRFYSSRGSVLCNADFAMSNVFIKYVVNDAKEDAWIFGDSYLSMGDPNRWATQLIQSGHKKVLLCGFGGATSADEIVSFRALTSLYTPKWIVWALGMNDGDSGAINASWKTYVDEVIATCAEKGIIPILATIPNVPNITHTYKNAYVKASGCRYVDFAKAVNAESAGATWYDGMLSNDNTHPSALGAKALMYKFIMDVPEVLHAEE